MGAPRLHVDGSVRRQGPALSITPRSLAPMGHREDFPRVTPGELSGTRPPIGTYAVKFTG
jgi:hypothetical protein